MATIEERLISGKGLLRVPDNKDVREARILTLYVSVFRRPRAEYLNLNYNPPKSRYATLNFFRDSYLLCSRALEFPSQAWDFYPELNYQNLYALDCVYEGILQTFVNLGNALNLIPISVENSISLYRHTRLFFDEIKVQCYADTAIKMKLESKPYDFCEEQQDYIPDPPPPPPNEVGEIPRGTPLEFPEGVSLPYDGSTFDNGDSIPYEGDQYNTPPLPEPEGEECQSYGITIQWEQLLNNGVTWVNLSNNQTIYGKYNLSPILIPVAGNPERTAQINILCQGIVAPGNACLPYDSYTVRNLFPPGERIRNVSISLQ